MNALARELPHRLLGALLGALTLVGVGCGDDGGLAAGPGDEVPDGGAPDAGNPLPPDEPPSAPIETLEDQLRELGVDVDGTRAEGRRLDAETVAAEDWAPLGPAPRLAPRELFMVGVDDDSWVDASHTPPLTYGPRSMIVELWDEDLRRIAPKTTFLRTERSRHAPTLGPRPDGGGTNPGSRATRAATAGDFDGDGKEEAVVLVARELAGVEGSSLEGAMFDDTAAFEAPRSALASLRRNMGRSPVRDLAAVAGEFDGDGRDDVVVAWVKDGFRGIMLLRGDGRGALLDGHGPGLNEEGIGTAGGTTSVELARGNVDWDPELETLMLLREWHPTLTDGAPRGHVVWWLYDDFAGAEGRATELARGTLELPSATYATDAQAVTADAVLADLDGDGLDEIAFAGLTAVDLGCEPSEYGVRVLDDLARDLAPIAERAWGAVNPACVAGSEGSPGVVYEVMANAVQWDGDHPLELQVNDDVLKIAGRGLDPVGSVEVLPRASEDPFSLATHHVVAADVTNDGLDEVLWYSTRDGVLRIVGHRRDEDGVVRSFREDLPYAGGERRAPVLVPLDDDMDGHALRYIPGSHRVELSEPIVHAVLAAPPCAAELGQDLGECTTTWGRSTTTGSEQSQTTTGTASATVGISVGGGFGPFTFEASYAATVEAWASATMGEAYELTYTIDYSTHGRDAVVFTSIPYDVYEYEIVGSKDADEIGERLAFFFPRRPVTRPVSVRYFNDRVRPGGLRIDERVLAHTAGDPTTYRTADELAELEAEILGRQGAPRAFLKNGPRDVGTASTTVGVAIEVAQTRFVEEAHGASLTHTVSMTGGVGFAEMSVGAEASAAIRTSMSETTSFAAAVPGVNEELYGYAFGMLTYMARAQAEDGGLQTFQVVDYWVE